MNSKLYKVEGRDSGLILHPGLPQPGQGTRSPGRPDFDLSPPEDWPQWLQSAHTENAQVQYIPPCDDFPEGKVIWVGGTFHDGIWMDGLWMTGRWRDGIWLGGDFYEGIWCAGDFREGTFHSWIWKDGCFRGGTFRGWWQGGIWVDGNFQGVWQRTEKPPKLKVEIEEWEKA